MANKRWGIYPNGYMVRYSSSASDQHTGATLRIEPVMLNMRRSAGIQPFEGPPVAGSCPPRTSPPASAHSGPYQSLTSFRLESNRVCAAASFLCTVSLFDVKSNPPSLLQSLALSGFFSSICARFIIGRIARSWQMDHVRKRIGTDEGRQGGRQAGRQTEMNDTSAKPHKQGARSKSKSSTERELQGMK